MKTKLINHPQYYLLVDLEAEIKGNAWRTDGKLVLQHFTEKHWGSFNKIIAHLPKANAPKLEGVDLLPHWDIKYQEYLKDVAPVHPMSYEEWKSELPNNEDDVVKLSREYQKDLIGIGKELAISLEAMYGFMAGYKAAKQSEKKYSEVIKLLQNICDWSSYKEHPIGRQAQQALDILQSLSTTKEPIDFILGKGDTLQEQIKNGSWVF